MNIHEVIEKLMDSVETTPADRIKIVDSEGHERAIEDIRYLNNGYEDHFIQIDIADPEEE